MGEQLFYEEINPGMGLPVLTKHPTTRQLVQWAGASGDYSEVHYDKDFAQRWGLAGVIVHGHLITSFLTQMLTDWIGGMGTLKRLSCNYKKIFYLGQDLICKGTVSKKYIQDGEHCVDCEVWVEDSVGETTTTGKATVIFPSQQ